MGEMKRAKTLETLHKRPLPRGSAFTAAFRMAERRHACAPGVVQESPKRYKLYQHPSHVIRTRSVRNGHTPLLAETNLLCAVYRNSCTVLGSSRTTLVVQRSPDEGWRVG
jgi:hypothetical protein